MQRRDMVIAAAAWMAVPAWASKEYPHKPIRLILSFPPGSTSDVIARFIGDKLSKDTGQPVIVESKPGAQGAIAARYVAKAPADGYTVFLGTNSTHAANIYLMKNLGYDPVKDFAPLTQCSSHPLVLVVRSDSDFENLKSLLDFGKENPEVLSYGTGNTGSLVAVQLLKAIADFKAVGVNYPGVAQACNDLLGGRLDFMMVDPTVVQSFVTAGRLKILGISTKERLTTMPDVRPISEQGWPAYEYASWSGFFAPAGISEAVQNKLTQSLQKILTEPEVANYLSSLGVIVKHSSSNEFSKFVKSQIILWDDLVKKSGLSLA